MNRIDLILIGIVVVPVALMIAAAWGRKCLRERGPYPALRPLAESRVPDHVGPCVATWLNGSGLCARLDLGVTGYFRLVRRFGPIWVSFGPEFHGIAPFGTDGKIILTTATPDPWGDDA